MYLFEQVGDHLSVDNGREENNTCVKFGRLPFSPLARISKHKGVTEEDNKTITTVQLIFEYEFTLL